MGRMRREKIPPPSQQEIQEAVERGQQVVAISADNDERCLFLKLACENGNTAVIWFDAYVADYLLRHLETVFLGEDSDPDSGSRVKMRKVVPASYGNAAPPNDQSPRQGPFRRPYSKPK
jgi:hypothetical protein